MQGHWHGNRPMIIVMTSRTRPGHFHRSNAPIEMFFSLLLGQSRESSASPITSAMGRTNVAGKELDQSLTDNNAHQFGQGFGIVVQF